ncbi:MAG: sigma-54-dependent Fis family transcriptional regulator [Syntrophorhabdales bacterium]|nr:sigma-54-dependent Fis family transcriptional regulator [Syntrophorhabdales bacterium]
MIKPRILIVDDEPTSRELLEGYLSKKGYGIECAKDGRECLEKINYFSPDIVILDVRLPDIDGLTILESLKTQENSPYIIIITAFHDMSTTIKAIRLGAFEYIPKPIDVDELEQAIERANELIKLRHRSDNISTITEKEFQKNEIIGKTKEMNEIFKTIGILSTNRINVLIEGETGTGKELVAKAIHFYSSYKEKPFVAINCSAIVENLLESELFGHEKGAFTGAISSKKGLLEIAEDGTVFLDEIGDMPIELQAKLLRVLQEREFQHVGGSKTIKLNARIIAATNKDLLSMVREGKFREDLYFRLSVATIKMPPLRERKDDIPLIVKYLIKKINAEIGNKIKQVEEKAMDRLLTYPWPGNIRELENVLTKAAIQTKGDTILDKVIETLLNNPNGLHKIKSTESQEEVPSGVETEKDRILKALNEAKWHYGQACEILGISRPTLNKKMRCYGIQSKPRQ